MSTSKSFQSENPKRTRSRSSQSVHGNSSKRHDIAVSRIQAQESEDKDLSSLGRGRTQLRFQPAVKEALKPQGSEIQGFTAINSQRGQQLLLEGQKQGVCGFVSPLLENGNGVRASSQPGKPKNSIPQSISHRSSPVSSDLEPSMPCTPQGNKRSLTPSTPTRKFHCLEVIIIDDDNHENENPQRRHLADYVREAEVEEVGIDKSAQSLETSHLDGRDAIDNRSKYGADEVAEDTHGPEQPNVGLMAARIDTDEPLVHAERRQSYQQDCLLEASQGRLNPLRPRKPITKAESARKSMRPKNAEINYQDLRKSYVGDILPEEERSGTSRAAILKPGETILFSIERSVSMDIIPDIDDKGIEQTDTPAPEAAKEATCGSEQSCEADEGGESVEQTEECEIVEEFDVERVVGGGRHVDSGEQFYEIQWVGYDLTTLEPASHCHNCSDKIAEWAAVPRVAEIMQCQIDEEQIVAMKSASNIERALRSQPLRDPRNRRYGPSNSQLTSAEQRTRAQLVPPESGRDLEEHVSRPRSIDFAPVVGSLSQGYESNFEPRGSESSSIGSSLLSMAWTSTSQPQLDIKLAAIFPVSDHEKTEARQSSAGSTSSSPSRLSLGLEQDRVASNKRRSLIATGSLIPSSRQDSLSSDIRQSTSPEEESESELSPVVGLARIENCQSDISTTPRCWKDTIVDTWTLAFIPGRKSKRTMSGRGQSMPNFPYKVMKRLSRSARSLERTSPVALTSISSPSPFESPSPAGSLSPTPIDLVSEQKGVKRDAATIHSTPSPFNQLIKREYSISTQPEDLENAMKARQANILNKCSQMLEELEALDSQGSSLTKGRSKADLIRLKRLHEKWAKCMSKDTEQEDSQHFLHETEGKGIESDSSQAQRVEDLSTHRVLVQRDEHLRQHFSPQPVAGDCEPHHGRQARDANLRQSFSQNEVQALPEEQSSSRSSLAQCSRLATSCKSLRHGPHRPSANCQNRLSRLFGETEDSKASSMSFLVTPLQPHEVPHMSVEEPLIRLTPTVESLAALQEQEKNERERVEFQRKRPGHPDRLALIDHNTGQMRVLRTSAALARNWDG